ncbi:MAG: acyltransferase [Pseudomonadota bacterium]
MEEYNFKRNNFDLIRLVAALQVAIEHGYVHLKLEKGRWLIDIISLFPGVPIFFVVSGFLIAASYERSNSMLKYAQNRVLRIYPALWVCFVLSLATVFALYPMHASLLDFSAWTTAQLTIGQFYNPDFMRGYGVGVLNGSLWTIPVELQFYLVLPLIYFALRLVKWHVGFIALSMVVLVGINQAYVRFGVGSEVLLLKLFGVTVMPYLYMFMLGVLLQRNQDFVANHLANKAVFWLLLFLFVSASSAALGFQHKGNYINPVAAVALALMTISLAYTRTRTFSSALAGYDISYGVYIYHMVVLNALIHLDVHSREVQFVLMIALTVLAAAASWRLVEKPALARKRYSLQKPVQAGPTYATSSTPPA